MALESQLNETLVSILMTAYNREQFITEAIESVLASTYKNWELIITDDCSVDNTFNIAASYQQNDKRIKVYRNTRNLGDYPNRNKAASYASGELLMSVDSDDLLLPETILKCVLLFKQHPTASFGIYYPYGKEVEVLSAHQTINRHFFNTPILLIGPGGSIIKKSYFDSIGGFPVKYGPANDGYYNLKAASNTDTLLIPFEFIFYRRHEGQEINNKYGYLANNYLYLNDALNEINLPITNEAKKYLVKKSKRRFLINLLKFYLKSKDYRKTKLALDSTNFKLKDVLVAVFQ